MTIENEEDVFELQQALGQAISAWASIEGGLCQLFCIAMEAKRRETAAAAFTAVLSFEVQLSVTRATMNASFKSRPGVLAVWTQLAKRIDKLRVLRNKLAHGHIIQTSRGEQILSVDFLPFHHFGAGKPTDHYEHWSTRDLNKLHDRFLDVSVDISRLVRALIGRQEPQQLSQAPNLQLGRAPAHVRLRSRTQPRP